jgi:hypothetical protein
LAEQDVHLQKQNVDSFQVNAHLFFVDVHSIQQDVDEIQQNVDSFQMNVHVFFVDVHSIQQDVDEIQQNVDSFFVDVHLAKVIVLLKRDEFHLRRDEFHVLRAEFHLLKMNGVLRKVIVLLPEVIVQLRKHDVLLPKLDAGLRAVSMPLRGVPEAVPIALAAACSADVSRDGSRRRSRANSPLSRQKKKLAALAEMVSARSTVSRGRKEDVTMATEPDNKTSDDNKPLAERVAAALKLVDQALVVLAIANPVLTPKERKRATKSRKGADEVIPRIATLSDQFGLKVPAHTTSAMLDAAEQVKALDPLQKAVDTLLKTIEDATFIARGGAWGTATTLYAMLKRLAKRNGEVKSALADVESFFAYRHPKVAKDHPKTKKGKAALKQKKLELQQHAAPSGSPQADSPEQGSSKAHDGNVAQPPSASNGAAR